MNPTSLQLQVNNYSISPTMFLTINNSDKKIYLWDEKVCSTVFTYEDSQNKIPFCKILVVDDNLFSNFIYAILPNKSLITVFDTSNPDPIYKTVPIEEPITSIHSNNKLLCIGSSKGNISVFDLSSGNNINSFRASFNQIDSILASEDNSIITVSSEMIKIFTFNELMNVKFNLKDNDFQQSCFIGNNNDSSENTFSVVKEFSSLVNNKEYFEVILMLVPSRILSLIGDSKVSLYDFPNLETNLLNVYFDEQITLAKINKYNKVDIFLAIGINVYLLKISDYISYSGNSTNDPSEKSKDCQRVKNNNQIINQKSLKKVITMEDFIVNIEVGSTYLAVAKESGEIHLFNLLNYQLTNKYCQIKGCITSILSISRPISQYGLNYNKNLLQMQIGKLEKINNSDKKQIVGGIQREDNYIDNILDDYLIN